VTFAEIRAMPQTIREIPPGSTGAHESVLRSFHIVNKVRELLILETPPTVLLDIIEDLRA
jgi:hypothetical protein